MSNPKLLSPAFPPVPTQDQFGRIVSLMPGMTLLDYAAITIYSANCNNIGFNEAVKLAAELIDELYKVQSESTLKEFPTLDIV